jgi:hypothetical protein
MAYTTKVSEDLTGRDCFGFYLMKIYAKDGTRHAEDY